jgi:hypothetical protein
VSLNDYDINRERKLVTNLITSKEFCEEIIPILDLNLLESYELQQVAKKAVEHFQRYGSPIGRGIEDWWLEGTQTGRFSKSEREFFADMLQSLNDEYEAQKDAGNTTYEIEQTIQYLKKRHLAKHYAKVRELLDTEKVEEAEQLIANYTLPTFTLNNSEGGTTAKSPGLIHEYQSLSACTSQPRKLRKWRDYGETEDSCVANPCDCHLQSAWNRR